MSGATCLSMPRAGPSGAGAAAGLDGATVPCIVGCEGGNLLRCQLDVGDAALKAFQGRLDAGGGVQKPLNLRSAVHGQGLGPHIGPVNGLDASPFQVRFPLRGQSAAVQPGCWLTLLPPFPPYTARGEGGAGSCTGPE